MKLFQKIYNSWWQLKQEIRIWVLNPNFRFCNRTRNARRISPPPPEIDREMRPRGCPIQDFMDFLYYRSTGKCEKGFVKLFSWTVFFFLACYACACETNDLQNSSNSFLVSSHPFSPLKKKKEERKKKKRKEWKELCYERKTCRLVAEELRINVGVNEKRSKKLSSADGGTPKAREILEPKVKIHLHTNCVA